MENYLQEINRSISLPRDEEQRNNRILKSLLQDFIEKMKEVDPLFKAMYRRVFYGGSYYDGLRVGHPTEFDLDLLLTIPKLAEPVITTSNCPGFIHLQVKNLPAWMKQPEAKPAYNNFAKLLDDKNYLSTEKVLIWMEGLVNKALNKFSGNGFDEISVHKGGPAMTLHLRGKGIEIDVDLVACFVFGADKWPKNGFKPNPVTSKPEFFIVPKKPKSLKNEPIPRYWRLSFQEQERALIDNKRTLKPTAKLLKRLRDNLDHVCIASYYIKTVLLHSVDKKDAQFWGKPLSEVFMTVLKEYKAFIERKSLPYYWNKNNNLLSGINAVTLDNINNRLRNVIKDLESRPETAMEYLGEKKGKSVADSNHSQVPNAAAGESSSCVIF